MRNISDRYFLRLRMKFEQMELKIQSARNHNWNLCELLLQMRNDDLACCLLKEMIKKVVGD